MVDEKKIALSPAYQIAALTPKEQGLLLETIDSEQATPSLSQAQRMKKLSQSGELNEDTMLSIMMEQKKPEKNDITLAYITAPWSENEFENTENAAKYCRAVYDAGFSPVCPALFLPLFLRDEIPQEHKDCIDMAREYLRRARVLVVCGSTVDESVKNDIAVAERLRITATTLDGILTVKGQGRRNE